MKIGLSTTIDVTALRSHLNVTAEDVIPSGMGGSAITPLIQGLLEAGHQVSVYSLDPNVTTPVILRGTQLTVYVGHFRPRARHRCFDLFKQEGQELARFIHQDQPDIVHAHWGYEFALGALLSGYPHLITLHDDPWLILRYVPDLYRVARLLLKLRILRKGKNFTAVSPYLAEALESPTRRPIVIPNAVWPAPGYVHLFPTGPRRRIVSMIAEWSSRKNVSSALLAFREVRQQLGPGTEYWLYGTDYDLNGPAHRWAKAHGVADGVRFAGKASHTEMTTLLPDFDVMLHPSREESFGLTLIEAMQAGVPIVAGAESGAVPWVLANGKRGILTDINSPAAIATSLCHLLTQPQQYEQLSKQGITSVQERFSIPIVTAMYEEQYRRVLGQIAPQSVSALSY
ncbi:glycosyl transferase group 1 [Hymenobacter roseosalivarius DSM 11622]|uniref:Glycosyl transferase group 1 n=1 Tax=Hymenobacter roseosalivarius DSM 11622 TaxID=645990 RepID=A0A1W1VIM3_9BACT|nr:glycosyltransferase family 4 protein [Hymenobacter roseosalivarius]SMB92794.1 glycosyl transferase group 1 [Hymenobacter roseosalivarius DSM 11622]